MNESLTPKNREVRHALISAWTEVIRRHYVDGAVGDWDVPDQWGFYNNIFMMVGSATGMLIASVANDDAHREWLTKVVASNIPLGCQSHDTYQSNAKVN